MMHRALPEEIVWIPGRPIQAWRFPLRHLSANRLYVDPRTGAGRWSYARERARWWKEIEPAPAHLRAAEPRLVRVRLLLARGARAYDYENFVFACKYLFDALRRKGWLVNDSPEWCRREYDQVRMKDIKYFQGMPRMLVVSVHRHERG